MFCPGGTTVSGPMQEICVNNAWGCHETGNLKHLKVVVTVLLLPWKTEQLCYFHENGEAVWWTRKQATGSLSYLSLQFAAEWLTWFAVLWPAVCRFVQRHKINSVLLQWCDVLWGSQQVNNPIYINNLCNKQEYIRNGTLSSLPRNLELIGLQSQKGTVCNSGGDVVGSCLQEWPSCAVAYVPSSPCPCSLCLYCGKICLLLPSLQWKSYCLCLLALPYLKCAARAACLHVCSPTGSRLNQLVLLSSADKSGVSTMAHSMQIREWGTTLPLWQSCQGLCNKGVESLFCCHCFYVNTCQIGELTVFLQ